jgi:hypothetical protein
MQPTDVKFMVLTAEYVKPEIMSNYSEQPALVLGVYERTILPETNPELLVARLRGHFPGGHSPEREIGNQTNTGPILAMRTIRDSRNVETILQELISTYGGESGVVVSRDERISPNPDQPWGIARFPYSEKHRILNQYFGLEK